MKLRNKKTGEILNGLGSFIIQNPNRINCESITKYDSLAELNEDWEDYEPKVKKYWWISPLGCGVVEDDLEWKESEYDGEIDKFNVEIGNCFRSKEEAEKAIEKLKAWQRLKERGFRFDGWSAGLGKNRIYTIFWSHNDGEFDLRKDLNLLFGGEE